jgi:hypothetical protein
LPIRKQTGKNSVMLHKKDPMTLPEIITNSNCDRLVHTTRTDEYLRLIQGIDLQGEEDYDCSAGNV